MIKVAFFQILQYSAPLTFESVQNMLFIWLKTFFVTIPAREKKKKKENGVGIISCLKFLAPFFKLNNKLIFT